MDLKASLISGVVVFMAGAGASTAWAQSEATIRGQLTAEVDGAPVLNGTITLTSAGTMVMRTSVDASGRFTFLHVSPGAYVLTGSSQGFSDQEVRLDLKPREIRTVTLALKLQGVALDVEVTAEAPRLPSTHSPSSTVLSAARIDVLPAAQKMVLPDAVVTAAPGMIRGHDDFVHVRGEEVALNPLIDGVSFWENAHAVFSAGFSPEVIDTANVMTGGFPAEYGNRFGGVVDVVTKSGLRMDHNGSVSVNGGEAGRHSLSADFGGRRDRIGYYAFGSLFESDRFLSPPAPEAIHDHGRGGHGFVQLDADLGERGLLRALVMADGTNFEIPKTPDDVALRPAASASQRTRQQSAIVGWSRAWSSAAVDATFYQRWSRSKLSPATGPLTAQAAQTRDLLTIGGKVDVTRFAGAHALKAGLDVVSLQPDEHLAYDYAGFRSLAHIVGAPHIDIADNAIRFDGSESGGEVSGYIQDDVRLGDRVTVNGGVRVDHYDLLLSTTHVSPRLNMAVQVGGGAVVHASYNHFFVPPPIEGVLSSGAGLTERIEEIGVGLPPVQPTTEDQVELGASSPVGPLRLGLTGYYRTSENPVHTTVWPDARLYSYASFDRARAYGMEAKAEIPGLTRYSMTGYLNYTLGRVYYYNPVTGGFVTEAEHIESTDRFLAPMDQTHTLSGGMTYRHARTGLWMGTAVEYGSGTPIEHGHAVDEHAGGDADHVDGELAGADGRVPGHFTANLSVGIDLLRTMNRRPRLTVQVDVENVGNNLYLVAQESEFSPAQYSIPRLVSVTAKVRF